MNESIPQTRLLKSRDRCVVPLCYENDVSKIALKGGMLLTKSYLHYHSKICNSSLESLIVDGSHSPL